MEVVLLCNLLQVFSKHNYFVSLFTFNEVKVKVFCILVTKKITRYSSINTLLIILSEEYLGVSDKLSGINVVYFIFCHFTHCFATNYNIDASLCYCFIECVYFDEFFVIVRISDNFDLHTWSNLMIVTKEASIIGSICIIILTKSCFSITIELTNICRPILMNHFTDSLLMSSTFILLKLTTVRVFIFQVFQYTKTMVHIILKLSKVSIFIWYYS